MKKLVAIITVLALAIGVLATATTVAIFTQGAASGAAADQEATATATAAITATATVDITSCQVQLALCHQAIGRQHEAEETHVAHDDETATARAGEDYRATADHARLVRTITAQAGTVTAQSADIADLAAARTPAPGWRVVLPAALRGT